MEQFSVSSSLGTFLLLYGGQELQSLERFIFLLDDLQDSLSMVEGNDNMSLYGNHSVPFLQENEFSGLKAEEAGRFSNLDRRLSKMVWQDDSSGLVSLMNNCSDNALESPKLKEDDGLNPCVAARLLQLACKLDSVKCAKVLLEEQTGMAVNINEMNEIGHSPLHSAAEMLSSKCIDLLLQKQARIDLRSNDGDALLALEIALASQRTRINWSPKLSVKELLVSLKDMDLKAVSLLSEATKDLTDLSYKLAVEGRVIELAFLLLVDGFTVKGAASTQEKRCLTDNKYKTMHELVLGESLKLLEIAKGWQCWNSAHCIFEKRQALLRVIELLHSLGVAFLINWDKNKKDLEPLLRASQAGDEQLVEALLRRNANDTTEDGNTSLHCYLKGDTASHDPRILRCMLKCGARVNQHNKLGLAPVHLASLKGNHESLEILLLHAPECVDILSVTNETPLFFAVKSNSVNCVKLLLQYGANRDALNLRRQRPIDLALSEEMRSILRTVYPRTCKPFIDLRKMKAYQQDGNSLYSDEKNGSAGMLYGFLELMADNTILYNGIDSSKEVDTKNGICRYFHSPNGCARGSKCYYSHGEEAPRLLRHNKSGDVPPWLIRFKKWLPAYLKRACGRFGEGEWYPLSSLKGDFRATCGMELDHESLGFSKLSDFLRSLPGICNVHVLPAGNGCPTHMVLRPVSTALLHCFPRYYNPWSSPGILDPPITSSLQQQQQPFSFFVRQYDDDDDDDDDAGLFASGGCFETDLLEEPAGFYEEFPYLVDNLSSLFPLCCTYVPQTTFSNEEVAYSSKPVHDRNPKHILGSTRIENCIHG